MRSHVLSAEQREEIVRRAAKGDPYAKLATEFGVTPGAISYHARKHLGPTRTVKVNDALLRKMKRAWDQGQTAREIANTVGLAPRTVAARMAEISGRSGRLSRKPNFFPPEEATELAYLAAMLDAEGCISQVRAHPGCFQVSITGSSPKLMEWLSQWGGHVYTATRQRWSGSRQGYRKQVYVWKLTTMWDVAVMLDTLLPYMIEKQGLAVSTVEEILSCYGSPPWAPQIRSMAAL